MIILKKNEENESILNENRRFDRVWDEADYVVPPAENGAFFITTNVLVTPNQTQSRCPENIKVI